MGKVISFFKDWRNQSNYFKWIMGYSFQYFPQIIFIVLTGLSATLLNVGLAILLKNLIDGASEGGIGWSTIGLYVVGAVVLVIIDVSGDYFAAIISEKFSFGIRKQIYEKMIKSYWLDMNRYHTGDLLTRLTSDASTVADGIVSVLPNVIKLFFELIVTFFTLYYFEPKLAIFALLIAPVSALVGFIFARKLKKIKIKVQESESRYRSYIQESLSNLLIVKAFSNEEYAVERLTALRNERLFWVRKKSKLQAGSTAALYMSFELGYIGAFAIGVYELSRNAITYGTMSIFLTLVNQVQAPVLSLAKSVPQVVSILASAGRIIEIQEIPMEHSIEETIPVTSIGVQVSDLSFGYSDDLVLENISLEIQPGEFVAIVGSSGIGKTTLIRLMMSFVNQLTGSIAFVDEHGVAHSGSAGTRKFMSYVPQGNTLFSGTILENVRMGKLNATEEEITEALMIADAHGFIQELKDGLNTMIGEKGHGLSEGQAQRIAIARAVIKKAPLLILDEATSALDENTEIRVINAIRNLNPRPTCLLITHRKAVLKYCDRELQIHEKNALEQPLE